MDPNVTPWLTKNPDPNISIEENNATYLMMLTLVSLVVHLSIHAFLCEPEINKLTILAAKLNIQGNKFTSKLFCHFYKSKQLFFDFLFAI